MFIPPTPTPMPYGTPIPINLQNDLLWHMAPNAVGFWNQFSDYTPVLQWVLVALLLGVFVWVVAIRIKKVTESEQ